MGEAGVLANDEAVGWRAGERSSMMGSMTTGGIGVLQLLAPNQAKLVPILGKRTGWDENVDKKGECASLENEWVTIDGPIEIFEVLPRCASYLQIKMRRVTDGGDHDVAICEITGTGVWDESKQTVLWLSEDNADNQSSLDPSSALYSAQLRDEGII